jgi:hypothetical protein
MAGNSALVEQRMWPHERATQLYVRHKRDHEHGDSHNEQRENERRVVRPVHVHTKFHVQSLKPNGSGTAGLTCGEGCGWQFNIRVAPNVSIFNLVDVDNGGNYVIGTAIRQ